MDDHHEGRRARGRGGSHRGLRRARVPAAAAACAALVCAGAAVVGLAAPYPAAAGGGDFLYPARDRYEAGQTVTMIGYGAIADPAWRESGPYYAFLRVDPVAAELDATTLRPGAPPVVHHTDVRVGEVVVEDAPEDAVMRGYSMRPPHRVSVTFSLPESLVPRAYEVRLCNDPCTASLDYFWPEMVNVGVDPAYPIVRDWPLTDPAIQWLEDDAMLTGPDLHPISAADVRAGRVPAPAPPAPSPDPLPEVTASPVTGADSSGSAGPPDQADTTVPPTDDRGLRPEAAGDGKALAWWVAGEVALLVLGCAALLHWSGRRRRGQLDGAAAPAAADDDQPALEIESTHRLSPTDLVAPATRSVGENHETAPAGGVRHALRVRL